MTGAPAELLTSGGQAIAWIVDRALVGLCATQVGVAEAALRMAAEYTSTREQFERPLAAFQAVAQRAADAYIDTEGIRLTAWQAVWAALPNNPVTPTRWGSARGRLPSTLSTSTASRCRQSRGRGRPERGTKR